MDQRFKLVLASSVAAMALVLIGCGDGGNKAKDSAPQAKVDASTPQGKVRARLVSLFALVKDDKPAEAAKWIVFRGETGDARNWKDVCDYSKDADKRRVDQMLQKLKPLVAAGAPTFVEYTEDKESEGKWRVWEVKFGEGESARSARLASLEIKGESALGDVDVKRPQRDVPSPAPDKPGSSDKSPAPDKSPATDKSPEPDNDDKK